VGNFVAVLLQIYWECSIFTIQYMRHVFVSTDDHYDYIIVDSKDSLNRQRCDE